MRQPKLLDYLLLILLALIWASAFFNIKIATYSFGPITIAFLRVFFGAIPFLLLCYYFQEDVLDSKIDVISDSLICMFQVFCGEKSALVRRA